jgi:YegS/Rv2252/BmrU family lipid kinase
MIAVIVNPISGARGGGDAGRKRVELARRVLERHAIEPEIFVTAAGGDARQFAHELAERGCSLVFAWGGDGTANEIGSALAFRAIPMALVPSGSGNGLARDLGISLRPEEAIAGALAGRDRQIDVGELNGAFFFNVAGVGLDAHIARLFNSSATGRRGPRPYLSLALRGLLTYQPLEYTITSGDRAWRHTAMLLALANSRQYGLGAVISPGARLDDGLIDLVIAEGRPSLATVWKARRLFNGTMPQAKGITIRRLDRATIEANHPMEFHVDGEAMERSTRLEFRLHPRALVVRVPH